MILKLSCTFIPSDRVKEILGLLWQSYKYQTTESRFQLTELRRELGSLEFARFQDDLILLMKHRRCARLAVFEIACAAVQREKNAAHGINPKHLYQSA